MTNAGTPSNDAADRTKSPGKSFDFSFSFGQKAPAGDPANQDMFEGARQKAAASPDGVGQASRPLASLEFSDGVLRVGGNDGKTFELGLTPDAEPIEYHDPFPALTSLRTWLHRSVMALAVALPIAFIVLGVATDQTTETTFYMALFGLLLSLMLVTSFMPQRTWFSEILQGMLTDAARRQRRKAQEANVLRESLAAPHSNPESVLPNAGAAKPAFEIRCQSCGARFTPAPPNAVCPHCGTAALPD